MWRAQFPPCVAFQDIGLQGQISIAFFIETRTFLFAQSLLQFRRYTIVSVVRQRFARTQWKSMTFYCAPRIILHDQFHKPLPCSEPCSLNGPFSSWLHHVPVVRDYNTLFFFSFSNATNPFAGAWIYACLRAIYRGDSQDGVSDKHRYFQVSCSSSCKDKSRGELDAKFRTPCRGCGGWMSLSNRSMRSTNEFYENTGARRTAMLMCLTYSSKDFGIIRLIMLDTAPCVTSGHVL